MMSVISGLVCIDKGYRRRRRKCTIPKAVIESMSAHFRKGKRRRTNAVRELWSTEVIVGMHV